MLLDRLTTEMINDYQGDPRRIQHFLKVHSLARLIGRMEGLDETTQFTLEAAALVHDIGIHTCEEKYGHCNGKMQEKEGPALASKMLTELDFPASIIQRVAYLVGHHHTYSDIDGIDYQILVEADFLVNLYEDDIDKEHIEKALENVFRTQSGIRICRDMFGLR